MKISLQLIARELSYEDGVSAAVSSSAGAGEMCIFSYGLLASAPFFSKGFIYVGAILKVPTQKKNSPLSGRQGRL